MRAGATTESLSKPVNDLAPHYDAIVVGSGYGGGVAASRLARMGLKVALLERGREIAVGDFPDTLAEAEREFQVSGAGLHSGDRTALFDLRQGRDIHVLVGCGLGGGSLINANVSLPPDPRVWEDPVWPAGLMGDSTLDEGFARAKAMLRPTPYPNNRRLDKIARLKESAAALDAEVTFPPINVTFKEGANHAGVVQPACTLCGDCCSGCNVGAKNTTQMTYLPDAVNHGCEIFCECAVTHVEKDQAGWRVFFTPQSSGAAVFDAPPRSISAGIVVLGAGTLGSTEILMRSREQGLRLSDKLGSGFTGNGDVLAFSYNSDRPVNGIGVGYPSHAPVAPPGPCIAGAIDLRDSPNLRDGMIIEEGVIPSGLSKVLPALFGSAGLLFGKDTDSGPVDELSERARRIESQLRGAYRGAVHNTQTFLVMAHDDGRGVMELGRHGIEVNWPKVARQGVFDAVEANLYKATTALGGTYLRNPLQSTFLGENLVTVHPLGGCPMGASREQGVVNDKCQVYDGGAPAGSGEAVHEGLYVVDGAVMPRPLGVNPLLTISAIAERAMIHLADDNGLAFTDEPMARAPVRIAGAGRDKARQPIGIEFTERMAGYIAMSSDADYAAAARAGAAVGTDFSFTLTIHVDNIDAFATDASHEAVITGTAQCAALSPEPLDVMSGRFNLMREDMDRVDTRRFDYVMQLHARDGEVYDFKGFKLVRDDVAGADLWSDTTTLFVEITKPGEEAKGQAVRGVLEIAPADFSRQMTTMKVHGAVTPADRFKAVAGFGKLFAGALYDVYGGVLASPKRYDTDRLRKKRDLRVGAPEVYMFTTEDQKRLRLTRYNGGGKGPLLFTHGLGVSSRIFSIDTIDTNLLEYFYSAGFDCWLLDFRASTDMPYSAERWTADDCAAYDYQPAIDLIRRVTRCPSVQVIAHCFGATTFVMAMLRGLVGVRAAVISQIATDVIVPFWPQRVLAHLRTPSLLSLLGIDYVDARATTRDGFFERLLDRLIRIVIPFQGEERTRNATSNRITALYGQLYETSQLNKMTFEFGLPEIFGKANIDAFKQLALIVRKRRIVTVDGEDHYLANLHRLRLPILFVHGAENACFKPESTARTVARLSNANGPDFYAREIIPDYGHIDCIFGKNAARDVYPHMLRHLEATAEA